MKNLFIAIALLVTTLVVQAQNEEVRNLPSFDQISVGESIKLIIEKGNKNSARVEASGVDVEKVLTEVSGSSLKIHMDRGNFWRTDVSVYLTYKDDPSSVRVSSSASLKGKSLVKTDEMLVKVSSSGKVELNVQANEVEVDASSSGRAMLGIDTDNLYVGVSSSGKVELQGNADYQKFKVSSSGRLQAFDLQSEKVNGDISSSGSAEVSVSKELIADASSSGKIYYRGNPDKVITDSSSSGKIRRSN